MPPFPRAALLGLVLLAPFPARAESPACADIAAKWAAQKADLQTPQVSALLFAAADNGCDKIADSLLAGGALIEAKDRVANTPLGHAAREGRLEMVAFLVAHGADIQHRNIAGSSALFLAIERHHRDVAKFLVEHGADPNAPGRSGDTPLAVAAFGGDEATVGLLLDHGADPKVVDRTGKAPIVYAAARGKASIVKRLLAGGIDINARYENDLTVLMWAAGHVDGVAEPDGVATVAMLLDGGARVDAADNRGRTALMIAAERGHPAIAKLLLARGANAALRDKDGKSARDLAADDSVRAVLPPG